MGDDRRDAFETLARDAWHLHERAREATTDVVQPSMPILYFGDLDAYFRSDLRVVTVGLNPSREEFPTADPWRRFPEGSELDSAAPALDGYLHSLNSYFHGNRHPYMRWFGMSFGAILRGLNASFEPEAPNTAIHTDLCSPVATDPTWSGLSRQRRVVLGDGYALWHKLVQALRPRVILMSVAESHLGQLNLLSTSEWAPVHTVERAKPYVFRARRVLAPDPCLLVWGRAAQLPFGSVTNLDKEAAGAAIKATIG